MAPSTGGVAATEQRRNGYRHRDFETRAGTLNVAIPKVREGNYFPEWVPQQGSERTLIEQTSRETARSSPPCRASLEACPRNPQAVGGDRRL